MYETPTWVAMVRDAAIVLAFLVALVAAVTAVGKFFIVRPLERYIDARTPKNGGKSLGDLHEKVDALTDRVVGIEGNLQKLDIEFHAHTAA
jgi:Na+-transporting methylmalonyl-CoA/oxaloacetate decarboxylase gamma subunit